MKNRFKQQKGYITLLLVIMVGAITTAMVITALGDGLGSAQTGAAFSERYRARSYADACVESALYLIHDDTISTPGSGSDSIDFDTGTCSYTAEVSLGGEISISAEGSAGRSVVPVSVSGTTSLGVIDIVSWN